MSGAGTRDLAVIVAMALCASCSGEPAPTVLVGASTTTLTRSPCGASSRSPWLAARAHAALPRDAADVLPRSVVPSCSAASFYRGADIEPPPSNPWKRRQISRNMGV